MSSERDLLPPHERQAAQAAIIALADQLGSQTAAAMALNVSQPTVNKAVLYGRVGPMLLREVLARLAIDLPTLLSRYGDPSKAPPPPPPKSVIDEAIEVATKYSGGVRELDVRAIAEEFEPMLRDRPIGYVIETLLREVRARIVAPAVEKKAAAREQKAAERRVRRWQDVRRQGAAAPEAPIGAAPRSKSGR